jgi:hypothetical protein
MLAAVLVAPSARATPPSAGSADPGVGRVRTNVIASSPNASLQPIVALPARRAPTPGKEDKPAEVHDAVRVGALAGIGFPRPLASFRSAEPSSSACAAATSGSTRRRP